METIFRVCYVARLQRAVSGGASLGLRHGRNPRLVCGAHSGHSAALRPLDPAAAHDPANEKTKHTQAPTVLWACSPQRHMTPQTKNPSIRRCQPCCGLQARNTAGKQACLVPQNGQETGACPQCPQCPLYQSVTGYYICNRLPIDNWPFSVALQWKSSFVFAMWHAFSVLFRVGASLGLRHGRNPRLVCGAHSGHSAALRSLDPAAAHDPANEKTKHTQVPTVLWACSPQRHMTPQTQNPSIRRRQPCCGLQARNTAGKQACLVPQNGQETGACPQCPQCPQCPLYQSVTGYYIYCYSAIFGLPRGDFWLFFTQVFNQPSLPKRGLHPHKVARAGQTALNELQIKKELPE
jgi:hypothetical protein